MTTSSTAISEADYCAIEELLQSSEKGRRFLRTYVHRHRDFASLRLLRSIARLHRAALGAPGAHAEVLRDLASILKNVSRNRQRALACEGDASRSALLQTTLEDVEAGLIALIESLEERAFEQMRHASATINLTASPVGQEKPTDKLFGELSSYFIAADRQ